MSQPHLKPLPLFVRRRIETEGALAEELAPATDFEPWEDSQEADPVDSLPIDTDLDLLPQTREPGESDLSAASDASDSPYAPYVPDAPDTTDSPDSTDSPDTTDSPYAPHAPDPGDALPVPDAPRPQITPFLLPLVRTARAPAERRWSVEALAGRLVELSAPAHGPGALYTAASALLVECQLRGEIAAWVAAGPAHFHPGDLVECGVDLAALPVVRAGDLARAARAADRLLRSGGFGLLILDLIEAPRGKESTSRAPRAVSPPPESSSLESFPSTERRTSRRVQGNANHVAPSGRQALAGDGTLQVSLLSRLAGLARHHQTVLVVLTQKPSDSPSIGSIVSLRAESIVRRTAFDRFEWSLDVLKDKTQGAGWRHAAVCRGPEGLC